MNKVHLPPRGARPAPEQPERPRPGGAEEGISIIIIIISSSSSSVISSNINMPPYY